MANFTSNSSISDVKKLKDFLEDLATKGDRRYFFDDGFPRSNDIEQDAKASLEVLAQFFADKEREMAQTQLGKYAISREGMLVNSATANAIPSHEPVFILRGKDRHARPALRHYLFMIEEFYSEAQAHREMVKARIREFLRFSTENEHLCKNSDTHRSCDFRRSEARDIFLSRDEELPTGNDWQDPKYVYVSGRIVSRDSGRAIPIDEPVFVLRAKDLCTVQTLEFYRDSCDDVNQRAIVSERINDFIAFSRKYPEAMKAPDSDPAEFKDFFASLYK